MCRIEEKIYIGSDGSSRTFQDTFDCDRARRRGKRCSIPEKRTREYRGTPLPKRGGLGEKTVASSNTSAPLGKSRNVDERGPSQSGRHRYVAPGSIKPGIVIQIGSKKGREVKYPLATPYKRSELAGDLQSSDSDQSHGDVSPKPPPINSRRSEEFVEIASKAGSKKYPLRNASRSYERSLVATPTRLTHTNLSKRDHQEDAPEFVDRGEDVSSPRSGASSSPRGGSLDTAPYPHPRTTNPFAAPSTRPIISSRPPLPAMHQHHYLPSTPGYTWVAGSRRRQESFTPPRDGQAGSISGYEADAQELANLQNIGIRASRGATITRTKAPNSTSRRSRRNSMTQADWEELERLRSQEERQMRLERTTGEQQEQRFRYQSSFSKANSDEQNRAVTSSGRRRPSIVHAPALPLVFTPLPPSSLTQSYPTHQQLPSVYYSPWGSTRSGNAEQPSNRQPSDGRQRRDSLNRAEKDEKSRLLHYEQLEMSLKREAAEQTQREEAMIQNFKSHPQPRRPSVTSRTAEPLRPSTVKTLKPERDVLRPTLVKRTKSILVPTEDTLRSTAKKIENIQKEDVRSESRDSRDLAEPYTGSRSLSSAPDEASSGGQETAVTHIGSVQGRMKELRGNDDAHSEALARQQKLHPRIRNEISMDLNDGGYRSNSGDSIPEKDLRSPTIDAAENDDSGIRVDEEEIVHQCDDCGRSYTRAEHLRRHQINHEPSQMSNFADTAEPELQLSGADTLPRSASTTLPQTEDDNISIISSYASSIFSVISAGSTGTDFSRSSGYSAEEITTATRSVAGMFQTEDSQIYVYMVALANPAIGSEKLERNLRRLFKQCAEDLKSEATDQLEYLGARLVSHQAKAMADIIVSRFGYKRRNRVVQEDSSDEEKTTEVFSETVFADLDAFLGFLGGSEAYKKFWERLEKFISPVVRDPAERSRIITSQMSDGDPIPGPNPEWATDPEVTSPKNEHLEVSNTEAQHQIEELQDTLEVEGSSSRPQEKHDVFPSRPRPSQYLSEVRNVQLRWQCRCRKTFEGNVIELRDGGILDLVERMERSTGFNVKVTQIPASPSQAKTLYRQMTLQLNDTWSTITSKFKKHSPGSLPHHNSGPAVAATSPSSCGSSQQRMLHLLACMHANRFRKSLLQDRVESVSCDRSLFTFMRERHSRRGLRNRLILSLNEVRGIFFVKFRLPLGGNVEVRHHNPCCQPSTCECIPPKDRVEPSAQAEYRCIPGPPSVWPPVDPQYLAHLFNDPSCVNENDTWILDQLPRRTVGELHGKAGQPAEGWGIYYQEGLNWRLITLVMVVTFLLVSLFGILWAYYKQDIQGAFGMSSYIFAACGIFLSLVAINSDSA